MSDLRYAWRTLRSSPVGAVAVITLALGIGANTAIFSMVKAVLLKPLPYGEPDRIVALAETAPDMPDNQLVDVYTAEDWRRRSRSFESFGVYGDASGVLTQDGRAEVIRALRVTSGFFDTLGVRMQLGRAFLPEEDRPDRRTSVVILSDGLWKRRFGSDPAIVGRVLDISVWHYTVVGILPPEFEPLLHGTTELLPEMYMPAGIDYSQPCRRCLGPYAIARLKRGIAIGEARAELEGIMHGIVREHPSEYHRDAGVTVTPMRDFLLGRVSTPLWLALGAVAFVLMIACVNVANLLLARATARGKEMALRAALGAGRRRLIRQLFGESLLLALTGGAAGLAVALAGTGALAATLPAQIPRVSGIRIDGAVFGFSLAVTLLTALLCGLAPAWHAARVDLNEALKSSGKALTGRGGRGVRSLLVAAEVALAFVLVSGAGLMGKSFRNLLVVYPGFDPRNVLTLTTNVWGPRYQSDAAELNYYRRIEERLEALPGIEGAAWTNVMPFDGSGRVWFHVAARSGADEPGALLVDHYAVSASYFRVLRIPVKRGRAFTAQDTVTSRRVAVLSETCAGRLFPGEDPIGKQIRIDAGDAKTWATVVGVVGDIRQSGLDSAPAMAAYTAQTQEPAIGYYRLVARTAGPPMRLQGAVREAFSAEDPMLPVYHLKSLEDYQAGALAPRTVTLVMLELFGMLALVLAGAGIYATISYTVALRTREMGIRMALGARRRDVAALVSGQALAPAAVGLGIGIAATFWLTRLLATLLFKVGPADLEISATAIATLVLLTFAASLWPARRAAGADPAVALRDE